MHPVSAKSGDTILVAPGTYLENLDFSGKDITLRSSEGPEVTIIDAQESQGVSIGPAGKLIGFKIRNAVDTFGAAISVSGSGTVISGNIFEGNLQARGGFGAAIGGNGASPLIERNLFRSNSSDNQHLSGVISFVNNSSPRIINNIFVSNDSRAINIAVPSSAAPQVINNTIVGNSTGIRIDVRAGASRHVYRNNIILDNTVGVEVALGAPEFVWEHNLVFGNLSNYEGMADPTGTAGNLSANPQFQSVDSHNFALTIGSPAIDAATSESAPNVDFNNQPRPTDGDLDGERAMDIGAYEVQPAPPQAPTALAAWSQDKQVHLLWNSSPTATGYIVFRSTESGVPYSQILTVEDSPVTDIEVVNGIHYFYVVSATNIFGQSPLSNEAEVIPGNRNPVAGADTAIVLEDSETELNVLANDSDPDKDQINLSSVTQPENGSTQINDHGRI